MAKAKRPAGAPERAYSDDEVPVIEVDDDGENWMSDLRLEEVRARGWQGSLEEYIDAYDRLGSDPLEQTPPVTR